MERKIYGKLLEWKNSANRKPLVLQGARQVGKTYIVNIFGANEYSNVIYCNFEKEQYLSDFFTNLDTTSILNKLSNYKKKEILPEHTLIIFDEIQACPPALTSLKYFCEDANNYHIIAMGSLFGISVHRQNFSFPVGKVSFLNMYPMDFEEFLIANSEQALVDQIKNCYETNTPLARPFHEKALEYYHQYLYVGGMPEIVNQFINTKNSDIARVKQLEILDSYFNDMGKYNNESEIPKTKLVYKNISVQLAKENKKFKYSVLKTGGRANEFVKAIEWLNLAGIASQLYRLDQIKLPLNAYKSLDDFKFYMNDVGLCCAMQNVLYSDIMYENPYLNDFKGGLTENYINNQLKVNNLEAYYWTSKNQAEIDFITRLNNDIIPIEVKSADNVKAKSLNEYISKNHPQYSIRISAKNFGFENNIKSIPLYATFCLKG